jgi:uncharacterized protein YcfJ
MKIINTIIIATILAFAAGFIGSKAVGAEYGRIISVHKNYSYVIEYVPRQECRRAPDPGNVLLGIILGGVSGKVITGEDGGAAIGALAGGLIASDDKSIVCRIVHEKVQRRTVEAYDVTYEWNGYYGESRTSIPFRIGDEVLINVSINLND